MERNGFMDFLRQNAGGPTPTGAPTPGPLPGSVPMGTPEDAGGEDHELMMLLMMLAQAIEQRQSGMPDDQASPMQRPNMAGTGNPLLGGAPDAGDLLDTNNEMAGNPLAGLFGQAPLPLRQPPPGVSKRRGY